MENWISVKDKLPKGDKKVLCYSDSNGGYLCIDNLGMRGYEWCQCFSITHWMPLPDPPKEEA